MHQEKDVIARLHKRDPALFEVLYDLYWEPLSIKGTSFPLLRSDEIEDIITETFIALWERDPEKLQSESHIKGFLYTTFKNKALNLLKLQKRTAARQKDYAYMMGYLQASDEVKVNIENLSSLLPRYLKDLSPRSKEVLELIIKEGLTYQQIAKRLGISVKNVTSVVSYAVKKLREMLEEESQSGPDLLAAPLILVLIKLILLKY